MPGPGAKSKINLLEALEQEPNKELRAAMNERSFRKRHLLFMPHHKEDLVFIVKQGKLRIYLGKDGKEISLAILGPGEIFATHTRAYVESLEETTILTCPSFKFFKIATEHSSFTLPLISTLGSVLSGTLSILENIYFNCADKRVAVFFYEQAQLYGSKTAAGTYVEVGLTVDNIAKIVGASRQTVSTFLSSLEKDGVLRKISRGEYLVRDMEELQVIANACSDQ
jgi:CRP-like cAMP-binding protein